MTNLSPRMLMALATLIAAAAIGGAWFSELGLGYVPCKLCLWQRNPYYIAAPFAVLALSGIGLPRATFWFAALLALIFVVSTGLGIYHAGVEWKFWLGPADCGGRVVTGAPSIEDFRKSLGSARVVLCDEAPMRVLGLSFAGWNAVLSAIVAAFYAAAARKLARG